MNSTHIIKNILDDVTSGILTLILLAIFGVSSLAAFSFSPKVLQGDELQDSSVLGIQSVIEREEFAYSERNTKDYTIENFVGASGFISKIHLEKDTASAIEIPIVSISNSKDNVRTYKFELSSSVKTGNNLGFYLQVNGERIDFEEITSKRLIQEIQIPSKELRDVVLHINNMDNSNEIDIEISILRN